MMRTTRYAVQTGLQSAIVVTFLIVVFFSQRCVGPVVSENVTSPSRSASGLSVMTEPSFWDNKDRKTSRNDGHRHEAVGHGEGEDSGASGNFATSTSPDPGNLKTDTGLTGNTGRHPRHEHGGHSDTEVETQAEFEIGTVADSDGGVNGDPEGRPYAGETGADCEGETDAEDEGETFADLEGETGADSERETDAADEGETFADLEGETGADSEMETDAEDEGETFADLEGENRC
ncbi:hypothetical protein BaRGS_00034023 [Batillaria attramentaria]|uniref:Transmembrane protein n=1 Tax=Batillaria attramentaria TaxID=370345 RepID=A0ABD0JJC8_9CAEN